MSLGNDLASIRRELGLSLEEIQSAIKIPTHTLKSIENGSIFDSEEHNTTYIRSFVRSYAKALKLDDDLVVAALDANEKGEYSGQLFGEDVHDLPESDIEEDEETDEPFDLADVTPPPIEESPKKPKPTVENVNWADMGHKFTRNQTNSKVWVMLAIVVFVIGLGGTGIYFMDEIGELFAGSETPATEDTSISNSDSPLIEDNTTTDDPNAGDIGSALVPEQPILQPEESATVIDELGDTLTVVLYAAFDRLEPVRVTSDLNWRTNPFWMEQGEAYNFDFSDTLLVRGQYSRMLLMFNGHVIEAPRQNYYSSEFNSVMLTRNIFDTPEYMGAAPDEFPYDVGAPDSTVYRINY